MTSRRSTAEQPFDYDVIVVGAGNAALCAALSANDAGAKVLVLERAPRSEAGGNSAFTAGAMRVTYRGFDDIRQLVPALSESDRQQVDFGTYFDGQFRDDMNRVTGNRSDPEMLETLVTESFPTLKWMQGKGVPFTPLYERQSFEVEGIRRFWGGLTVGTENGGTGLIHALMTAALRQGIEIWFESRVTGLSQDEHGRICGVQLHDSGRARNIRAPSVVLACGGFEANSAMRSEFLGDGWENAKVRGTRFNQGDGHNMAAAVGAAPYGQWSGAHAVFWESDAPPYGNLEVSNKYSKLSYPLGIVLNLNGDRFIDEGEDFRNYTYARYGREVLKQPEAKAWQIFDAKVSELLQVDYRMSHVNRVTADTLEDLVAELHGIDAARALRTIQQFNESIDESNAFDPTIKDGRCTLNLSIPKSNWANRIDTGPFEAYSVTCGITFTFGGVRICPDSAAVLNQDGVPIPGLTAAGELVGGLFFDNYPGGSGLTAGAVFGRLAGRTAAANAQAPKPQNHIQTSSFPNQEGTNGQ